MGVPAKDYHELAASTREVYDKARVRALSPRVRAAQRLYASGTVPTKKAAAEAVGLKPGYFYLMTSPQVSNPEIAGLRDHIDQAIEDQTVDMSKILQMLGRKAVGELYRIMRDGGSEIVKRKAAQDLADRSPETSKTIKAAVANIHLSGSDAKELAAAMVTSARAKEKFAEVAEGDFVRVDLRDPERDLKLVPGGKDSGARPTEPS
jgi:hypothetical protein